MVEHLYLHRHSDDPEVRHAPGADLDALAERHGLSSQQARAVLDGAERAAAADPGGRSVLAWFAALVERGSLVGVVGKRTLLDDAAPPRGARGRAGEALPVLGKRRLAASSHVAAAPATAAPTTAAPTTAAPTTAAPVRRGAPLPVVHRDAEGDGAIAPHALALVERALRGITESLDPALRAHLEALMGRGLGDVRVHRDRAAHDAAIALGARAFAVGRDIFFREHAYDPGSAEGVRLIAHEVAHTQQAVAAAPAGELRTSARGDAAEREADDVADLIAGAWVARRAGAAAASGLAASAPPVGDAVPVTAGRAGAVPGHALGRTSGPAHGAATGFAVGAGADRARAAAVPVPAPASLQPTAARRGAVALQEDPPRGRVPAPTAIPEGGVPVGAIGVVAQDESPQLRLRATPSTTDDNLVGTLPFNTHVQIVKRFPGDWLFVSATDGRMGYCAAAYVWSAPEHPLPEPNARLHRVAAGRAGYAIAIAEQYFGDVADDWGQDLRFYVNVLAAVNRVPVPSSVDGWRSVAFQPGRMIWIPSRGFARGMIGQVSSGSYSYEAADAIGVAGAIERVGELLSDFGTAIDLAGQYIPAAIRRHAEEAIVAVLESLMLLAVGAVALLAITTAIGAAVGALLGGVGAAPGAAVGFEVGLALIEWIGLGFLVVWIASSVARIGTAFGRFFSTVWGARGDRAVLDLAARQFADAIGVTVGVLIEALVMWAAGQGLSRAVSALRGTAFGRAFGESRLGTWLGERIARYRGGETAVPGPREVALRAQARELAPRLGLTEAEVLGLLRTFEAVHLRGLHEQFGSEPLRTLAGRTPAVQRAFAAALRATGADAAGRASLVEGLRLNGRGTLSNAAFEQALVAYTRFRATYGDRVSGDFMSRFWRQMARNQDARQAASEIRLAEDILAGRTPLGEVSRIEAIPESGVQGGKVPEYRATTAEGPRLVENKAIGEPGRPITEEMVRRNIGTANKQIRAQAEATGEQSGGLIRIDGRDAGASPDVTPEVLLSWVNGRVPSPPGSLVTRWVEIFYRDGLGRTNRVVLELGGNKFKLRSQEVSP